MISVVIPCYNESEVLRLTYRTLADAAGAWGDAAELLLIDDGSTDDTWAIIEDLAGRDPRVRGLRLSRNFGHQAAMGAGLERARGAVVLVLDADLQDPPALVAEMLARWRAGYDVVYARRQARHGESWFKRASASLFYRVLDRLSPVKIPRDVGDFALMDAKVAQTLVRCREHALFWRGLRQWAGFRQTAIVFDRPERAAGASKYTVRKMLRLAVNGLLNFSEVPLRLPLYAGGAALVLTLLAGAGSVLLGLTGHAARAPAPGTLALFFLGAVQLLSLAVIGEYLNRIYEEVRDRTRWIVSHTVGGSEVPAVASRGRRTTPIPAQAPG